MTTKLRLLLDEAITETLARAIEKLSSVNSVYVRDVMLLKGAEDSAIIAYARQEGRIVVTTDTAFNERAFAICTHPGIIVFRVDCRHEAIHQEVFQKFLLSGSRKHAKDAMTYLKQGQALIRGHEGEQVVRF